MTDHAAETAFKKPTLDSLVVPGFLLLLAADLLVRKPSHQLAWRLLHGLGPTGPPGLLSGVLPTRAVFDRDPLGLFLAGIAVALAGTYLVAALLGASTRLRGWVIALGVGAIVLFPTFLYVSVGAVTGRPFGQDGGIVQLPLAMDRLLLGQSPYGADYSDSVLGRESRSSAFWHAYGENPIVRHHAYLPGTHLLALPFYLGARLLGESFDARIVSTLALLLAIFISSRLFEDPAQRLVAAAIVGLNPLVYWHQAFGANDMVFVALLLGSARAGQTRRFGWAGALLGLACATKQLAWPFAPFLLVHWASIGSLRDLALRETWTRLSRPILAGIAVFAAVVLPVALLNPRAFWGDIVSYNAGLSPDAYPLGGTPGFGIGNLVIYIGGVHSLRDAFPFHFFYLLLAPLGMILIRSQIRRGGLGFALAAGSVGLLAAVYFSRVAHSNYLIGVATLLPLGIMLEGAAADAAVTPLALLGLSTMFSGGGFLQSAWESASAAGLPLRGPAIIRALSPRASYALTSDPLGLALSAVATGLALAYAVVAIVGATPRVRGALVILAIALVVVVPTAVVSWIGLRTGVTLAADQWAVQARSDAARLEVGESPYAATTYRGMPAREAWSSSFDRKPRQPIEARKAALPPGSAVSARAASVLGFVDARAILVVALAVLLWICGVLVSPAARPLVWTAVGLLPPMVLGIIFGAGEWLWLAVALMALAAVRRGKMIPAGLLAGAAFTVDLRAILVVSIAAVFLNTRPRDSRRFVLGALGSFAAIVGPIALLDPRAMTAAMRRAEDVGAGAGIVNIAAYLDLESSLPLHALLALSPLIAGGMALLLLIRVPRASASLVTALWLMTTLFLSRDASGFALAPPITLLVLSSTPFVRNLSEA